MLHVLLPQEEVREEAEEGCSECRREERTGEGRGLCVCATFIVLRELLCVAGPAVSCGSSTRTLETVCKSMRAAGAPRSLASLALSRLTSLCLIPVIVCVCVCVRVCVRVFISKYISII